MRRVERFWEWEGTVWEQRADAYSPEKAKTFEVTPKDALFPALIERDKVERRILFQGKAAYAHRQAGIRHALRDRAHSRFAPYIPALDGGKYRDIGEFTPNAAG